MDPNFKLNLLANVAVSLIDEERNKKFEHRKVVFKLQGENGQDSRIVLGHLPPLEPTPSSLSSGVKEEERPFKTRRMASTSTSTSTCSTITTHHDHDHSLPPTKKERKKISPRPRPLDFLRPEPQHLPTTLQNWIRDKGGQHLKFIHQKYLKSSDVRKNNNRLSIPVNQVHSPEFFSQEEKERVKERDSKGRIKGMQVKVVDQNLREYQLCLKQWEMAGTSVYNLITRWNQVVRDNNLRENSNLQLWSFRLQSQLCFALVKVPEVINIVEPTQEVVDHHLHEVVEETNMVVDLELRLWPSVC